MASAGGAVQAVRLPPLPTIRDILKLYKLKAMRQLSQNFLLDAQLNNKIVKCCGSVKGAEVCEIGPGPGNITRSVILKGARKVHVVEKDARFLPCLEMLRTAAPGVLNVVHGDILQYDMQNLFEEDRRKAWDDIPPNIHLIGNLPFNIASPLIIRWLKAISERNNAWSYGRVRMTLTFQKEVAQRMESPIMTSSRCRLSVMCQNWCDVRVKLILSGKSFLPKPKVDVGVVHFIPHIQPIIPLPFELVEKVVRAIFTYRQKYVIRGIQTLFPTSVREELAQKILSNAEIDPQLRSFQLSNVEIGRVCSAYKDIIDESPGLKNFRLSSECKDWINKERQSGEEAKMFHESETSNEFY